MSIPIRIASRGSRLALAQAESVRRSLTVAWPERRFEIVRVETRGDRELDRPLPEIGGKGVFTEALERALLAGDVDLAVHSLKDLPSDLAPGLKIGAVAEREDPRDVWVSREEGPGELAAAAPGWRIGTSSERRRAQILARRPDVRVDSVRGNVETRLRKLDEARYDALVMAAAGLRRLGLADRITSVLDAPDWLPAPGQGALAVESRADDTASDELLAPIDDDVARAETDAERSLLAALQGGCQVPVGAWAKARGEELVLHGLVALPDGSRLVRAEAAGELGSPAELGRRVAAELLALGADAILAQFREAESQLG